MALMNFCYSGHYLQTQPRYTKWGVLILITLSSCKCWPSEHWSEISGPPPPYKKFLKNNWENVNRFEFLVQLQRGGVEAYPKLFLENDCSRRKEWQTWPLPCSWIAFWKICSLSPVSINLSTVCILFKWSEQDLKKL